MDDQKEQGLQTQTSNRETNRTQIIEYNDLPIFPTDQMKEMAKQMIKDDPVNHKRAQTQGQFILDTKPNFDKLGVDCEGEILQAKMLKQSCENYNLSKSELDEIEQKLLQKYHSSFYDSLAQ